MGIGFGELRVPAERPMRSLWTATLATALSLMTACASGPEVRSQIDPSADLSRYKTYAFMDEMSARPQQYQSFLDQHLSRAIGSQMQQRGYKHDAERPDLLVNYNVAAQNKVSVTQSPVAPVGYYGYRRGMYGWGMGVGVAAETDVQSYTEGTLNIDVVDATQKKLLWEGVAVGRIRDQARDNPQQAAEVVVAHVFEKFPHRP